MANSANNFTVTGLPNPPPWAPSRPGEPEPERFYPEKAALAHVQGAVSLQCRIAPDNTPADCRVLEEGPGGWGFGETAVHVLAAKMKDAEADPGAFDGQMFIDFDFRLKGAPPPPPALDTLRRPILAYTPYDRDLGRALKATDPTFAGTGWAVVKCVAAKPGGLHDCRTMTSSRPNPGFGSAMAALASLFKVAPKDSQEEPVADRPIWLRFRVNW